MARRLRLQYEGAIYHGKWVGVALSSVLIVLGTEIGWYMRMCGTDPCHALGWVALWGLTWLRGLGVLPTAVWRRRGRG